LGLSGRFGLRFPARARIVARRRLPYRGAALRGARGRRICDAGLAALGGGRQQPQIRRPAARLPLAHVTQSLAMTMLQSPGTATLVLTPELIAARRIIASPGPVAHSRELGAGKQFQLPHATNYPGRRPRSHAHINGGPCQFSDQRHASDKLVTHDGPEGRNNMPLTTRA
jgi:hypothetical protein